MRGVENNQIGFNQRLPVVGAVVACKAPAYRVRLRKRSGLGLGLYRVRVREGSSEVLSPREQPPCPVEIDEEKQVEVKVGRRCVDQLVCTAKRRCNLRHLQQVLLRP